MDQKIPRTLIVRAASAAEHQDKIERALHTLEEGADFESLRVLTSLALEKHPSPWEVHSLFRRSLTELGWSPSRRRVSAAARS